MTDEGMELEGEPKEASPTDEAGLGSQVDRQSSVEPGERIEEGQTVEAEAAKPDLLGSVPLFGEESAAEDLAALQEVKPETVRAERTEREEAGSQVDYSRTFRSLSEGDVVDGIVVHIDKEGVLVDVGTKSEGIIWPGELSASPVQSAEDVVTVGDRIDVYVLQPENQDGNPVLSKKRADFETAWERVQHAYEEGKRLTAMVTDRVKGGLVVDLGIRGFVPGSHVGTGKVRNLDRYVGQSLPFKVIEVDRERRKVVLSHRLALEEERGKQREKTMASLVEGQIRDGVVRRVTDYGAFIDLGGIDGLLHVSEMSWTRVNHPSEVVRVGQRLQVMILKLNLEAGRVSLGLRQILPDPWAEIDQKYKVGQIVSGAISRLVPFGAFVHLDGGIEGIIPNAELSRRRVKKPDDVVSVGGAIQAKIVDIRPEERRMTLSARQIQEDKERKDYESYQSSGSDVGMTLGDLVGDQLQKLVSSGRFAEDEKQAEEAVEPVPEPEAEESAALAEAVEIGESPGAAEAAVESREPEVSVPVLEAEEVTVGEASAEPAPSAEAPADVGESGASPKRKGRARSKKESDTKAKEAAS
ncbi:MAG TPA: 30S ribosomal protein S1 [Armatimonadota bacterium]|nr:30S ribosomal protein S1 [Armatimonadota bacterium]